ncbi:ATP-grasp fold amidoligase family protein [Aeromonas sp. Marseille-Q7275]
MSFLKMLRSRFEGKDNNVPWELDNKLLAYEHASRLGFKTPTSVSFSSAQDAVSWANENFGKRFVVKAGDRHSCIGVYLLEKNDDGSFLELLRIKRMTAKEIGSDIVGKQPSYWIAESFVDSYVYGKDIPFDYKFYTFKGNVALIIQIDRNVTPPRAALFDGAFIPLRHGIDYHFDTTRWLPGGHVVPFFAPQLISMASILSKSLNTDFVSIDCFDSPDGPIFGEFTFAPGAPDAKMITFSHDILEKLDLFCTGEVPSLFSGVELELHTFKQECNECQEEVCFDLSIYSHISSRMSLGDKKTAAYIDSKDIPLLSKKLREHFDFIFKYIGFLQGDGEQAYTLATRISSNSA